MTTPDMEEVVAEAEYRVGNPSAWDDYDERASEILRALLSERRKMVEALTRARRYVADLPIVGDADLALIDAALTGSREP